MGLPQVIIEFKAKADTAVKRSGTGIVAVILKDNTGTFDTKINTKESEIVQSHWTATNKDYLSKIFMGGPSRVIAERIGTTDDYDAALARLQNKVWNYLTIPAIATEDVSDISSWVILQRDSNKKTFKAVLPNVSANHEGVVNFTTDNIKVGVKTYTTAEYCARIAGILAGRAV